MHRLTLILFILMLILCACQSRPLGAPYAIDLPIPPEPVLPVINESELECISDNTYKQLVIRDIVRKYYAKTLRAMLEQRQNKVKQNDE